MEAIMTPLGANLHRLRKAAGWTQQDLAVAAGLNTSIVSQIEQGKNQDPRLKTLQALAKALGVTVDALVNPPDDQAAPEPPAPRRRRKTRGEG